MPDRIEWAVMIEIGGMGRWQRFTALDPGHAVAIARDDYPGQNFHVIGREVGPWRYVRLDDGRLGLPVGNDG